MKTSTSFLCSVVLYTILLQATALTAAPYALTLPPGWTLVANHLNHVPNNRLGNIFNAPLPPDGAMVVFWDQAAQQYGDPYTYLAGYGWLHPIDPDPDGGFLNPGEGAFFFNPTAATIAELTGG